MFESKLQQPSNKVFLLHSSSPTFLLGAQSYTAVILTPPRRIPANCPAFPSPIRPSSDFIVGHHHDAGRTSRKRRKTVSKPDPNRERADEFAVSESILRNPHRPWITHRRTVQLMRVSWSLGGALVARRRDGNFALFHASHLVHFALRFGARPNPSVQPLPPCQLSAVTHCRRRASSEDHDGSRKHSWKQSCARKIFCKADSFKTECLW